MIKVTISRPTKSSMQSGVGDDKWVIAMVEESHTRSIDPVMGWTSSTDMGHEVKLEFHSIESAKNFAKSNSWDYEVIEPKQRKLIKKSYADNFSIA